MSPRSIHDQRAPASQRTKAHLATPEPAEPSITTAVSSTAKPSSVLTFSGISQLYPRLYPREPTELFSRCSVTLGWLASRAT
jgi:hypothetical protein